MQYILAADIGTQGTKATLFDENLRAVCTAFEASKLIAPKPGTVWQEADDIFGSVVRTFAEIVRSANVPPAHIAAIGIDAQMAGIMGVNAKGEASTVYDSWLDTRCGRYMDEMRQKAGGRITQITGGPVTYTHGPKILWWKNEQPQAYKNTAKFVLPSAYVVGKMVGLQGGDAYFDYTGLQYSGFGDNFAKAWSDELLETFGIEKGKMARIVSPFEMIGGITAGFAAQTGLVEGTPVVAGGGDTACSVLGSGMFTPGVLLDCAGTASVLCSVVDEYVPDTRFETMTMMRSPVDGQWFPLAYINGGGLCLRWFRDELTGTPPMGYAQLDALAEQVPPGSEEVLFVPHFAGRVLPSNPHVRGSFIGLNWKHTKSHLYRAVMEGIGYEYANYLHVLRTLYPQQPFDTMFAVGGGAASRAFLQIKADVLGVSVTSFETGDTALIGSAVVAGMGCGLLQNYKAPIQKAMRRKLEIAADAANHAAYRPYAEAYRKTIAALESVYAGPVYKHP